MASILSSVEGLNSGFLIPRHDSGRALDFRLSDQEFKTWSQDFSFIVFSPKSKNRQSKTCPEPFGGAQANSCEGSQFHHCSPNHSPLTPYRITLSAPSACSAEPAGRMAGR
jgi:hypothetical protein